MPSIDERIVSVAFENRLFETRVATTMATLSKLDTTIKNIGGTSGFDKIEAQANKVTLNAPMSALDKLKAKLSGAGQGAAEGLGDIDRAGNKVTLEGPGRAVDKLQGKMGQLNAGSTFTDIERASDRVSLSGLTSALENVTAKFSVLQGAAAVALGNIQAQAVQKGLGFAKGFAFAPIMDGLHEYQTNLQAIQTVQANTDQPLTKINTSLEELNRYSDQTIYNFGEMAKNIGTFTAAGVDLKTATSSIKGIANMAALSGSNSQQASTAMYQLSQAIASGKVGLQDWNSVVNAGMGGKKLQSALATTAVAMGDIGKSSVKLEGPLKKLTINGESFRESIMAKPGDKPWLTSDVLVNTLATLDGRFSKAALSAELTKDGLKKYTAAQVEAKIATNRTALEQKNGVKYTDAQFAALMKLSDSAFKSATEVKTLGQVFDVAKETIGSGWSASFQSIFGNLKEAKILFTGMSTTINGFINANAMARNKVLHDWKELGGRTVLIEGIKIAFHNLMDILAPIKEAFRDIFPAKTGRDLFEMSKNFTQLMAKLEPSQSTIDTLRRIFAGLFAALHIGFSIVKAVAGVFFDLLGVVGKGSGGFLGFIAGIGDFIVAVDKAIAKADLFKSIFETIGTVLSIPLKLLGAVGSAIVHLFSGANEDSGQKFEDALDGANAKLKPLKTVIDKVVDGWEAMVDALGRVKKALDPFISDIAMELSGIGTLLADAFKTMDFDKVFSALQTGFVGGIFLVLKKAFGDGLPSVFGDSLEGVNGLLKGFTGNLEAMQKNVKADTLLKIAAAILVLSGGIYILSKIKGDDLSKAMTAVAVGLGELMGAMKLMSTGMGKLGILQLPIIAGSMVILAIAVTILAGAMKIFATMSWDDISKGMVGVAGAISAVGLGMKLMPPTLPLTAAGLILIGVALNIIAAAMVQFAAIKMEDMAKGIFAIVEALGGIALGVSMMPPTLPLTAAGLILMGIALASIAGAIKAMGSMDFITLIKGLGAMMAAIAGIGLAMSLVPPTIALTAAGLFIVANAMVVLSAAMKILGTMSIGEILKSLAAMGGALLILGAGLIFMSGTLAGSAALLAAAVALAILAPTLAFLGTLSWGTIIKGLAAIALVLGVLSVIGLVASAGLIQLGIALLPLAAVFVLTAGAVFLFAKAMQLLGAEGGKGVAVMVTALTAFIAMLPTLVISFIKGLLSIVEELAKLAPQVVVALGVIIDTVIAFVIASAPKLAVAIMVLVQQFLNVLTTNAPKIFAAGFKILNDLLSGISSNIGSVVTKVTEIITRFLNALSAKAPQLVDAGVKTLTSFLQGITNKIPQVVVTVANMVTKFIQALTSQVPKIIGAGQDLMIRLIGAIAAYVPKLVSKGVDIILSFVRGIADNVGKVVSQGATLILKFIEGIGSNMNRIASKGADAVIKFLNSLEDTIRTKGPELRKAGWGVADALLDGMWAGIDELGQKIVDKLGALVRLLPDKVKKILGIKSPSTVFMGIGRFAMMGFQKGIEDHAPAVVKTGETAFGPAGFVGGIQKVLGIHSPSEVFRDIGMNVTRGFRDGLLGSKDDVLGAFESMNSSLIDKIRDLRTQVADGNTKVEDLQQQHADKLEEIAKLRKEKKPDKDAINQAVKESQDIEKQIGLETAAVNQNGRALSRAREIRNSLTRSMKDEQAELLKLKDKYTVVNEEIEKATATLDKITAEQKRFVDQYNTPPDIANLVSEAMADAELTETARQEKITKIREEAEKRRKIDQVALYKKALEEQIIATGKYQETLQKLRDLGLDDATYNKLLEKGLAGQDFASQLLASGKKGIDQINQLDSALLAKSTALANAAIKALYDTGVATAQGVVDGLKSKKAELEKQMTDLADVMVNAIKSKLKIKSPSRIFMEVGKFTAAGLVQGLRGSSQSVTGAAEALGGDAAGALKDSLSNVLDAVGGEINPDLVITPVLDLSQVKKDARQLGVLTNVTPITAAASFGQASTVSQEVSATRVAATETASSVPTFAFEQNNYSPEALSDVEIYRQTKNQLGQIKSALGLAS